MKKDKVIATSVLTTHSSAANPLTEHVQTTSYNGRVVSYPVSPSRMDIETGAGVGPTTPAAHSDRPYSSTSTNTNAIPSVPTHHLGGTPPPYSATELSPRSVLKMDGVNPITNLTPENAKLRAFFFQLKEGIVQQILLERDFLKINNDNYTARPHDCDDREFCCCITLGLSSLFPDSYWRTNDIPSDINYFATRIALGLVYIYQDYIRILTTESYKDLIECFVMVVKRYIHPLPDSHAGDDPNLNDRPSDFERSNIYTILMSSLNMGSTGVQHVSALHKTFKTVSGFEFSNFDLFSTGVRTLKGGKLEPTNPQSSQRFNQLKSRNDFPLYRWGTMDVIALKDKSWGYSENYPRMNTIGLVVTEKENEGYGQETSEGFLFWQEVAESAQLYLTQQEQGAIPLQARPTDGGIVMR